MFFKVGEIKAHFYNDGNNLVKGGELIGNCWRIGETCGSKVLDWVKENRVQCIPAVSGVARERRNGVHEDGGLDCFHVFIFVW